MSEAPGQEMPFLDHLEELRKRLFWMAGSVVVGIGVAFYLLSKLDIIRLLERPILPLLNGQQLIYTAPGTSFKILLTTSLVFGIILASPVIIGQIWGFLSPALYRHEKRVIIPVLIAMVALFLGGVALSYFVALPLTLKFLMSIESTSLTPMITATAYFDLAISMCVAFGLVFEVPIAVLALTALGIVTPQFLSKYLRHAILICVIAAAFITPGGDPYSLVALTVPLYVLYELSVAVARVVFRKREKREARRLATVSVVLLLFAPAAASDAQIRSVVPIPRENRVRADTARADSLAVDTTRRDLVKWDEPDSVMRALIGRQGYSATRYQGDRVQFNAQTRTIEIDGERAAVGRDQTLLVADSITYNDSTKLVFARGDTVVLRDPRRGSADLFALGAMTYNISERRGTVARVSTSVETGQTWYVYGGQAAFVSDTASGGQTAFYARNGTITSCDDETPDYHFRAKEIKMVSKNILVARPAVLYIADVPVMWLPFIFQDMRSGRRSGVLTPRFGISEVLRNSPTYRRHAENLGYYFAISDYMDAELSFDWRSGSRPSEGDPGWVRFNGAWQYRWLDRFLSGSLRTSHHAQRDGSKNTALSWNHSQSFSQATHLTTNINFVTNTFVQRTTHFDPRQVLATIRSEANYQTQLGQTRLSVGGARTQYPGRTQVTQSLPSLNISSPTIAVTPWLDWTPSFDFHNNQELNIDQVGEFSQRFFTRPDGTRDSVALKRDQRISGASFNTPIKIRGFSLSTTFRASDREDDFPATVILLDPADTARRIPRVFARRFRSELDWQSNFSLPSIAQGTWRLTPFISFENVHPGAYWVRTELSGGQFVHQSKRARAGISSSPTLFALFPGFGPVSRFRHALSPRISYSYTPKAEVNQRYLSAINENPTGYIGAFAQNKLSLNLSHVLEAKLASRDTSATAVPRKMNVLAMNFSPLEYDFERARQTGRSGFATDRFSTDLTSDLLPSFRAAVGYSLYEGTILSDTARFKPYRESIDVSFSLNSQSGIFAALNRVFGRAVRQGSPSIERVTPSADDAQANAVASTPSAGAAVRNRQLGVPPTRGWQASFTFTSQRQRPPTGGGIIIEHDPAARCLPFQANPIVFQQCVDQQAALPVDATPFGGTTAGGAFVRMPPRENLNSQMSFHFTPNWSASWGTNYDFTANKFGSHAVTLQRALHDWTAIFSFNQAQNGNFAFSFFIALNAQPDLKFDYDKQTYRSIAR